MDQQEIIASVREFAVRRRRKLGPLLLASLYDEDLLGTVDRSVRQELSNQWLVVFLLHEDYRPQGGLVPSRRKQVPSWLTLCEAATFLVDNRSGQITKYRPAWPLWFRRCWRAVESVFARCWT